MLAILAPGQGAQTPGFLAPWLELPSVADRLSWLSSVAGVDLVAAGTTATAEEIRDTALAQPLIVAAGLAVAAELGTNPLPARVVAGHSVGELTAAALSGALATETALTLVRERARAMAAASAATPTGMSAVLGGDAQAVDARLAELGLTAANRNGAGQIVAAGPLDGLARLADEPPAGARVRPLQVAGAFHTSAMAPARERLAALAAGVAARDPRLPVLSNADGAVVTDGAELLRRLVAQVEAPVRWDACMDTLAALGVTAVIELPPGGTLVGLVRRALPGVRTLAVKSPDDLVEARTLLAEHAVPPGEAAPPWRIVVAPTGGTFHALPVQPGTAVEQGAPVGTVVSARSEATVPAPYGGVLVEWLAHDGDPVGPGQPIARLHPQAVHA